MPFLKLDELDGCNCFKSDNTPSPVIIKGKEVQKLTQQAQNLKIVDKDETYNLSFSIKGSTYDQMYQENLKNARQALSENGHLEADFHHEPENPVDKNAIAIYIKLVDKSLKVGYVPGPRISQISKAITTNDIINCTITAITRRYIPSIQKNIYFADVSVLSRKKFSNVDNEYYYNKPQ